MDGVGERFGRGRQHFGGVVPREQSPTATFDVKDKLGVDEDDETADYVANLEARFPALRPG